MSLVQGSIQDRAPHKNQAVLADTTSSSNQLVTVT